MHRRCRCSRPTPLAPVPPEREGHDETHRSAFCPNMKPTHVREVPICQALILPQTALKNQGALPDRRRVRRRSGWAAGAEAAGSGRGAPEALRRREVAGSGVGHSAWPTVCKFDRGSSLVKAARFRNQVGSNTRLRKRSKLALPYPRLFKNFNRLLLPSTGPLLQSNDNPASTAA